MATKRRGSGEGSIFRRADGRWTATITAGYTSTGKRMRRTVYGKTKGEVQGKLTDLQSRKAAGTLVDAGKMTVAEWLDHWLENIAKPGLRPNTYVDYRGVIDLHLIPRIGRLRLTKLSPVHLQGMYAAMRESGKSPRLLQKSHATLRAALNAAMRQGQITSNACMRIDSPKYSKPEMKTLSAQQVGKFLSESQGNRFHALYVLAVTCGLRQGELFGLQWDDIDLDAGTLSVRRTLVNINGRLQFGPPKTKSSARRLTLPAVAVEALHAHRVLMLREGHAGAAVVFCDTQGGPLRKSNFIRKAFKPMLQAAGLPAVRFHDLRHTSATLLLMDGVHPKIVQERLGHSQISMTLDTYSHVLPSMDEAAAGTFDRITIPKKADQA